MPVDGGRHLHAIVLEDFAALRDLVRTHERRERRPALVGDARLDVERVGLEQQARHPLERRRAVRVHRREPRGPAEQPQRTVAGVVIRVLVRDEDRAELADRQLRERQLSRDAVPAVDEINAIADDDRLRGRRTTRLRRRTAGGPEQDQSSPWPSRSRRLRPRERRRAEKRRACCQKGSARNGRIERHTRIIRSALRRTVYSRRTRPRRVPTLTASVRLVTPSFSNRFLRWVLTVRSLIASSLAISLFAFPSARRRSVASSRGVSCTRVTLAASFAA